MLLASPTRTCSPPSTRLSQQMHKYDQNPVRQKAAICVTVGGFCPKTAISITGESGTTSKNIAISITVDGPKIAISITVGLPKIAISVHVQFFCERNAVYRNFVLRNSAIFITVELAFFPRFRGPLGLVFVWLRVWHGRHSTRLGGAASTECLHIGWLPLQWSERLQQPVPNCLDPLFFHGHRPAHFSLQF